MMARLLDPRRWPWRTLFYVCATLWIIATLIITMRDIALGVPPDPSWHF